MSTRRTIRTILKKARMSLDILKKERVNPSTIPSILAQLEGLVMILELRYLHKQDSEQLLAAIQDVERRTKKEKHKHGR